MAKYLKLFMVALFATLTLSLTACGGDDDDEPDFPDNGGNSSSEVAFNLNGKDYYWQGDLFDLGELYDPSYDWGRLSVGTNANNEQYVLTMATAYSRKPKDRDDLHYSDDINSALIAFEFKNFNWQTAKKGQVLEFNIVHRDSDDMWWGCEIEMGIHYSNDSNIGQIYTWYGNNGVKGTAKFVSFKNNVVTIEFSNVTMTNYDFYRYGEVKDPKIPTTLTLNGSVPFVVED